MDIERAIGKAPRTVALAEDLARLSCGCVGCTACRGLCQALIDLLILPEIVVKGKTA